jgi:NAD-dependent dihydropyrimidine dehydrogenase PreA subunit
VGTFIQIDLDHDRITPEMATQLVRLCPVDIFGLDAEGQQVVIKPENEDECTLCRLCLRALPTGALRIRRTYSAEVLESEGITP